MSAGAIDERIREVVDAHRTELEKLVDQALERELNQLVEQRLNGHAVEQAAKVLTSTPSANAATKVCEGCGETKPETAFEKYRNQCRECRRRDRRTTDVEQAPAEPDRPAAITAAELARRAERYGAADPRELERWLVAERLAEATAAGLVATPRGVALADGLDLTTAYGR